MGGERECSGTLLPAKVCRECPNYLMSIHRYTNIVLSTHWTEESGLGMWTPWGCCSLLKNVC